VLRRLQGKQVILADVDTSAELVLTYDLDIARDRLLLVAPIMPAHAAELDAKVRIWSAVGVSVEKVADQRGAWKERGIEVVPEKDQFPTLVMQGFGAHLELSLRIGTAALARQDGLATFVADRALIQVMNLEDGSQQVRSRYLMRRIFADHVDLELPLPIPRFPERPTFKLGGMNLQAIPLDKEERGVRLKLPAGLVALPAILEISYTLPADTLSENAWWRSTMYAPSFTTPVIIGQMRWQLTTPRNLLCASLGRDVRPEISWSWQNGLRTPGPALSSAELDSWLTDESSSSAADRVTYAFARISSKPVTVYHLPRAWWLLGCSGLLLAITLGGYLAPIPRWAFAVLLLTPVAVMLALTLFYPAALAPVAFGIQPGVAIFLALAGGHWWLRQRERRRLDFLPGYARARPESTMASMNGSKQVRGGSTLDAAAMPASPTGTAASESAP
jgi:hypothetical protein